MDTELYDGYMEAIPSYSSRTYTTETGEVVTHNDIIYDEAYGLDGLVIAEMGITDIEYYQAIAHVERPQWFRDLLAHQWEIM